MKSNTDQGFRHNKIHRVTTLSSLHKLMKRFGSFSNNELSGGTSTVSVEIIQTNFSLGPLFVFERLVIGVKVGDKLVYNRFMIGLHTRSVLE